MELIAFRRNLGNILGPTSWKFRNYASSLLKDKKSHFKKYAKVWKTVRKRWKKW